MKKYFIFAALVTAGLLTSCSSSDDIAANDVPEVPTVNEGDLVPIKLNVAQYGTITRGTGTVGGVIQEANPNTAVGNDGTTANPIANVWQGQKVNVYMFKTFDTRTTPATAMNILKVAQFENPEGTLVDIYNDAELTTPKGLATGTASYLTGDQATTSADNTSITPAADTRYVKYYPMTDRFDFWGYRIDNAANKQLAWKKAAADPADPDEDATVTNGVPQDATKLNVSFDIDGTQDVLAAVTTARTWATTNQANFVDENAYNAAVAAKYSASSARKGLDPELSFAHKLTRLTFEGQAGDNESQTVYVRGIRVRPLKSIANGDSTWYSKEGITMTIADINNPTAQPVKFNEVVTKAGDWATNKPKTLFELKKRADGDTEGNQNLVALFDQAGFDALTAAEKTAANLGAKGAVAMTGTWNAVPANCTWASIGESIILPPAPSYEVEILLAQVNVVEETADNNATPVKREVIQYKTLKEVVRAATGDPATSPAFEAAYTYDFKIKVYGLQRIDIATTLEAWKFGENVDVDTDN